MIFRETPLRDACIIDIERREDERGFFARTWCKQEFENQGIKGPPVQVNVAFNKHEGTLRGMHYQVSPYEEAKLIRCTRGSIYDVIIDLRPHSPSYKEWFGIKLTEQNHRMLYVPEGFAHGYQTLEPNTEVTYQVSQYYVPNAEQGIRWNDPSFRIEWPVTERRTISRKDQTWPDFVEK